MAVNKSIMLIPLAGLLLAGCAGTGPDIAIQQIERPNLILPNVDQVNLSGVTWYVIGKNSQPGKAGHVDEAFRKAGSSSLIAVSPNGYKNISVNNAKMVKAIKQLQAQVRAYKGYYEKLDKQTDKQTEKKKEEQKK